MFTHPRSSWAQLSKRCILLLVTFSMAVACSETSLSPPFWTTGEYFQAEPDNTNITAGESIEISWSANAGRLWTFPAQTYELDNKGWRIFVKDSVNTLASSNFLMEQNSGILSITPYRSGELIAEAFFQYTEGGGCGICQPITSSKSVAMTIEFNPDAEIAMLPVADASLHACMIDHGVMTGDVDLLDCSNRGITDLRGIGYLYNVKTVILDGNSFSYLEHLHYLENLENISIQNTGLDCGKVSTFTSKQSAVVLSDCQSAYNTLTKIKIHVRIYRLV